MPTLIKSSLRSIDIGNLLDDALATEHAPAN
jgi:hypothetical protein